MEAPLLVQSSGDLQLFGDDGDYLPAAELNLKSWWRVFCIETVKIWRLGGPIAFQIVCQYSLGTVITIFVGHLGDVELSAFSIALSVVATFSFGFMLGMGSALETLCGQAFGAGQVHLLGIYMQRSILILSASCLLLSPLYIFATPILKLLGQGEEIANLAGHYTLLILPELVSLAVTFPTQKFLQAQSKVSVLAWVAMFALIFEIILCWLFINVFGWGATGAAVALDLTAFGTAAAQFVYVIGWCDEGWKGFSWGAFQEIWAFVRLSFASAIMLCLEVWYIMSIIILTGHLDNAVTAVGSLSICINIDGFQAMVFLGVNAAISVRVSNELGMGHPRSTRYAVYVTLFQSLLIGILCVIIILLTRNHLSAIFSNSEDMRQAVAHLSGLLGITMLFNSIQPVISGTTYNIWIRIICTVLIVYIRVAVGAGWQSLVAYINLVCYYGFGLPCGYLLGHVAKWGVMGLWGGMIAGVVLQTLLLLVVLYKTNWNKEVEQATERMRKWGGQDEDGIIEHTGKQLPIKIETPPMLLENQ